MKREESFSKAVVAFLSMRGLVWWNSVELGVKPCGCWLLIIFFNIAN